MAYRKEARGPYICYFLDEEITAASLVRLRALIDDDLIDEENDIAIILDDVTRIDNAGLRFFMNLDKKLAEQKRMLVFVGVDKEIHPSIYENEEFVYYLNMLEFERDFHEMNPKLYQTFYKLAEGEDSFRTLKLQCPLCGHKNISGYIVDTHEYRPKWSDEEITITIKPDAPEKEFVDYSKYQVAVCPNCFFASSRLDWFHLSFKEGQVQSMLTSAQIDALNNKSSVRRAIVGNEDIARAPGFFQAPREKEACYLSWALNEVCQKSVSTHKKELDGFDIATSNFLMCKFTPDPRLIDDKLTTALAWLHDILTNQNNYSKSRIAAAYVYVISTYIALGKPKEYRMYMEEFNRDFKAIEGYEFYLKRARSLVEAEESNRDKKVL